MTYNTTAIILNRRAFREADLRVTFFSQDFGKGEAVAVGAKKIQSKLAGHLEPWREVRLMLAKGRYFDKIGQAVTINNFNIYQKKDEKALWLAGEASRIVEKMTALGQKESRIYELLKVFLEFNFRNSYQPHFLPLFNFKILDLAGFSPEIGHCLICQKSIEPGKNYFNFQRGGLICSACSNHSITEDQKLITDEAITTLLFWRQEPMKEILTAALPVSLSRELKNIIDFFLIHRI